MARPREFDMETAVDGAMQIFWRVGYAATNLPDLLRAMGLTRGSFYKAFGDKHSAYLAALDHYDRTCIGAAVKLLNDKSTGDGTMRLLRLFEGMDLEEKAARRGCFVCNAMVEHGPGDATVVAKTTAMSGRLEKAIFDALGDVPELADGSNISRHRKAAIITRLYLGAQAMSKTGEADADWKGLLGELLKHHIG
jgi:TetR/AcrR family transcriptional repressor of nem operon